MINAAIVHPFVSIKFFATAIIVIIIVVSLPFIINAIQSLLKSSKHQLDAHS